VSREFPVLETNRLLLRAATLADVEAVFAVLSDEEVCRYTNVTTHQSLEQSLQVIEGRAERFANDQQTRWGIALKETDLLVGSCGFNWPQPEVAEVGCELARAYWRHGIMSEALAAILTYGFDTLRLQRIEAQVMLDNTASKRLLTGLGFREEGLAPKRGFWKGEYHDLLRFVLSPSDWRSDGRRRDA
jgi:[ribosomal protein S5]-alanine N-acetyltransferase